MIKIAPSLLSSDFTRLGEEVRAAESAGADMLHIDVMDGHFVPNITIGPFIVEAVRKTTKLPLDVHLMIEEPDRYIKDFAAAGADFLTVHVEASIHLNRTVSLIRENSVKPGVSLNPATPVCSLDFILPDVDLVLVMSVNPGFGGQGFISGSLDKIKAIKENAAKRGLKTLIAVDGGVRPENSRDIAGAGADILVMGAAFFGSGDYKALMGEMRKLLDTR
ncbi:MAG: ribulose-phosphate 3-epimerase [Nitrospirota bacterium]